ncbi:MAG TPA: hypothetical protein VGA82_01815 [Dehalococcoidales bacterium]
MKIILNLLLLIGLLVFLVSQFFTGSSFDNQLDSIVKPYVFSLVGWELGVIPQEIRLSLSNQPGNIDDEIGLVTEYFQSIEQIKALQTSIDATRAGQEKDELATLEIELSKMQARQAASESTVEMILERQIRETLTEQGIFNPLARLKINFPPVNFKLAKPPHILIISPRDRIESSRQITLESDLSLDEMENIEAAVDELGVSSLVVEIGGIATYPTFVTNDMNLRATIDTAVEEWVHQYLSFKPLGFLYLLDLTHLRQDYEIATINETLAGMVSKEIGRLIYQKYYASREEAGSGTEIPTHESGFDFNREMREIRQQVDLYLAQGEIERAEQFMEAKRQYLASQGYYLRKLNQAYFAFHGTYADSPTSVDPIGRELKELRGQSASLKDFLNRVAAMTSRQALKTSLE